MLMLLLSLLLLLLCPPPPPFLFPLKARTATSGARRMVYRDARVSMKWPAATWCEPDGKK